MNDVHNLPLAAAQMLLRSGGHIRSAPGFDHDSLKGAKKLAAHPQPVKQAMLNFQQRVAGARQAAGRYDGRRRQVYRFSPRSPHLAALGI
jgi:hypothetical protein